MNNLKKILKGSLIGVGAILPGVSGGVIAAAFNIYEELITALSNFTKHPLTSIKSIWQYLIGIAIGLIIGYALIVTIFAWMPLPITFLFIGLILGDVPNQIKEIRKKPKKASYLITFLIALILMVGVFFLPAISYNIDGFFLYIVYALIGFLIALSFIIPGLSGTMLLMSLGFYSVFLNIGDTVKEGLIALEFSKIWPLIPDVIVVVLGAIIGLLILSKPIHYAIKEKRTHFSYAVLGIILISPANILLSLWKENEMDMIVDPTTKPIFDASWYIWLISGFLLLIGFVIAYIFLRKKEEIKIDETEENQINHEGSID